MPAIHIQLSPAPSDSVLSALADAVLDSTERVLGKDRALTAVFIDALPATRWWIGGRDLQQHRQSSYCLTIGITDETNTKAQKAQYIADIHRLMQALLGPVHACSYVHVHDVRATAYGYGGQTQEWRYHRSAQVQTQG
jgi:4-oxalocrotonate tautomerase